MIDDDQTGLDEVQVPFHEQPTLKDITPLPGSAGLIWPPPPRTIPRQGLSIGMLILFTVLATALIGGSLGFIIYSATAEYHTKLSTQATALAQSTMQAQNTALARTQVVVQATNKALATVQAGILATATAQVGATATAGAISDMGTATATALGDLLANDTTGSPTFTDNLTDNTGGNRWDEGSVGNGNTGCFFNQDYHARETQVNFLQSCYADATNFSNFVYRVQMTIDKGSQGGILFRANKSKGQYYLFRIGTDGSYTFEVYDNNKSVKMLSSGISAAINTGDGQSNDMAVLANKNTLYLYVNQQLVTGAVDSTLSAGQIGVAAIDYSTPTEVEFSSVQVWKL
jgi:VCBS repeat-containing protein